MRHPNGPAWVLAGPGSGKTEVLALLVLRLLYVNNDPVQSQRVDPESIFVTTFTEKAARNLADRIGDYRRQIVVRYPDLASIDTSRLHLGTLHGLCNDLLQQHRAPNYQNVRLMDDLECSMFVYEQLSIVKTPAPSTDQPFWTHFSNMFSPREWQPNRGYLPSKWNSTAALVKMFNRIVEDGVSVAGMQSAGGEWGRLASLYDEYQTKLRKEHRCDFAHLQLRFLEFLQTAIGQRFRDGDESAGKSLQWVLVDEYQDTNRIQEQIYLTLASRRPFNIVVVGDDDQAMYRFRGGSVECMVTFDHACHTYLSLDTKSVRRYPLVANFRSHPEIVSFCNDYITAFPSMAQPGARVPNKPPLVSCSTISGGYPAVGQLRARNPAALAGRFADTVRDLVQNHVVQDYSQCCLLLKSTRESPRNAGPYVDALRDRAIRFYNPRNKAFLEQEEVRTLLGALLALLDPDLSNVPQRPQPLANMIASCRQDYLQCAAQNPPLAQYLKKCRSNLEGHPDAFLSATVQELVYYLLALPPFDSWADDPVRRLRLSRITALVESYAAMPVPDHPEVSRGGLRASTQTLGGVSHLWMRNFYYLLFGYLSRAGLDEEEDDDVVVPTGMVPIMTMHQAKGLQFPFVFVGHMGERSTVSVSHYLETKMAQFPGSSGRPFVLLPEDVRAELDFIRQYYVAYSRAQCALILMGTEAHFTKRATPCGPSNSWLPNRILPL